MPVYVYRCDECDEYWETWQSFEEEPLSVCPDCEGDIHRVPQVPMTILMATPVNMVRFKREEAQRIRGNREMLEGIPGAEDYEHWRKERDRKNATLIERARVRLRRRTRARKPRKRGAVQRGVAKRVSGA